MIGGSQYSFGHFVGPLETEFGWSRTQIGISLSLIAFGSFISPFIGRLDDIGADGINLISEIVDIYENFNFETEILAASIRSVQDVVDSAKMGADIATIPPKIISEIPLPIPFSVINSPNQTKNIVPAVSVINVATVLKHHSQNQNPV